MSTSRTSYLSPTLAKGCSCALRFAITANCDHDVLCVPQLLGGNGYVNEYSPGRLLRDAKLYEIGAGTSEIRRLVIGRALFQEGKL